MLPEQTSDLGSDRVALADDQMPRDDEAIDSAAHGGESTRFDGWPRRPSTEDRYPGSGGADIERELS